MRCLLIFLLIFSLLTTTSCQKVTTSDDLDEDSIIIVANQQLFVDNLSVAVNISSKTIHLLEDCPYRKKISKDNLRYLDYNTEYLNTLLSMGYELCRTCSAPVAD